jgi:uncharacterized protein YkwD
MRAVVGGLLLLACAGCQSAPPPPPDPATQVPALEARIFALVNADRHTIDPKANDLALDQELVDVARKKSVDMAAKDSFADGSGDPHISATRLMAADAQFQGLLGENVASQRYYKEAGIDVERSAQMIVGSWLASPSHKDNLAFGDYTLTGVGAAISGDTIFVTQLFATKSPAAAKQTPNVKAYPSAAAAKADRDKPGPALRGAEGAH